MKRKTKDIRKIVLFITILTIVTVMLQGSIISNAASTNTFKSEINANKKEAKPGEEVVITVKVSDIDMGDKGINTLEGTIEYDKNIFEEVTSSNIQSLNKWGTTFNDENSTLNGKFLAVNLTNSAKETTEIMSVKFKVKSNVNKNTTTKIVFKDITSNDGTNLVNSGTKEIAISINGEKESSNTNNTVINNTTNVTGNTTTNTTTNKIADSTPTQKNTLPKTGISGPKVIGIVLLLTVGVVIFLAIKNKEMKDI